MIWLFLSLHYFLYSRRTPNTPGLMRVLVIFVKGFWNKNIFMMFNLYFWNFWSAKYVTIFNGSQTFGKKKLTRQSKWTAFRKKQSQTGAEGQVCSSLAIFFAPHSKG